MKAMELSVLVSPTDISAAITDVARTVEQAALESLFLAEHTHVPVSRRDVLVGIHSELPRILDQFTVLGAAAAVTSRLRLGPYLPVLVGGSGPLSLRGGRIRGRVDARN